MKTRAKSSIKIENIVASGAIAESIDLEFIGRMVAGCTYTRQKFPGAVFHLENPKSAVLIFSSGRIVLTGHHRFEDIPVALQTLLDTFKEAGIACLEKPKAAVTNIVCTSNLGIPLNLVRITMALMDRERVEYEPEAFPGLVLRMSDPRLVFLLFSSGKIVITGGKTLDDVRAGFSLLLEKLNVIDNNIHRMENVPAIT